MNDEQKEDILFWILLTGLTLLLVDALINFGG
jgi:hypothetical protein